ncbi:uncharacterized protein Tco025E_05326 [Trypanosoma conorhini]|uniref:Uncharacterized protein n=1 Tax=Trypanosoma conorhini TaxID=83891 RepID=A0A3R7P238_9TRYP|nr:uncharacterized protein Tco025E_05326 [Trypanosoma conorhini]RNF15952.1 hypothetical protein Tco025E_05326 [Trypanosoma conorhini]
MTLVETTAPAFAATSRRHVNRTVAQHPSGDSGNGHMHQAGHHDACLQQGRALLPLTAQTSGEGSGNYALQPPIALLSCRCRRDPAVMRLQAALAHGEPWSSDNGSPEAQAPSSEATNSAATAKSSFSFGYDDDAVSSFPSTPDCGSTACFSQRAKSPASLSATSSAVLTSGCESSDSSSAVEATVAANNRPSTNCYWASRRQQGIVERQEGLLQTPHDEETNERPQTPLFGFVPKAAALQDAGSGMRRSGSRVRGVPMNSSFSSSAAAAAAAAAAAWEVGDRTPKNDEDAALSQHEEDEVLGVTAEGEFIYRRDVDAERGRLGKNKHQSCLGGPLFPDECSDDEASCVLPATAPFCTPEKSIFATALSGRARVPHRHGERAGTWRGMTATHPTAPLQSDATVPQRGSSATHSQRKTTRWRTSDVEWCSLLLQYRTCENADEAQYKKLIDAVNNWHEARRRYPIEALERRLLEGDSYDRPPFILRW